MSVCPAIDTAPGSATVLRPISVEPVRHEGVQSEKKYPEKWPVADLLRKIFATHAFLWGKYYFLYIFPFTSNESTSSLK
jgi:hypothetical protein